MIPIPRLARQHVVHSCAPSALIAITSVRHHSTQPRRTAHRGQHAITQRRSGSGDTARLRSSTQTVICVITAASVLRVEGARPCARSRRAVHVMYLSGDAVLDGEAGGGGARRRAEFVVDGAQVLLDRPLAEKQ